MSKTRLIVGSLLWACSFSALGQDLQGISLPRPQITGGMPLMEALKQRQSSREFSTNRIPLQLLADLLWAAAGISRPESGKRTVPSARDWQEVGVYVVMEDGAYLYDAHDNRLQAVASGDLRPLTGKQDFVATAPVNLVYVADLAKMNGAASEDQALYYGADTGFISQNVYLFCTSAGLATVVRAMVDREVLGHALHLSPSKRITLVQTLGYPREKQP